MMRRQHRHDKSTTDMKCRKKKKKESVFDNVYCNNMALCSREFSPEASLVQRPLRQHGDNKCTHSLKHDVVNKVRKAQ